MSAYPDPNLNPNHVDYRDVTARGRASHWHPEIEQGNQSYCNRLLPDLR
jgi:hypothetical protein